REEGGDGRWGGGEDPVGRCYCPCVGVVRYGPRFHCLGNDEEDLLAGHVERAVVLAGRIGGAATLVDHWRGYYAS
ncbi:unnamed protein product, partial [Ilex paraguariensis]